MAAATEKRRMVGWFRRHAESCVWPREDCDCGAAIKCVEAEHTSPSPSRDMEGFVRASIKALRKAALAEESDAVD